MSDSHDLPDLTSVQRTAHQFVAFVLTHQGRFRTSILTTNNDRGPFVAELALFPRPSAPRVRVVVGRGLAAIIPVHIPIMPTAAAESLREMYGVAIKIADEFEGMDCGGTQEEIRAALASPTTGKPSPLPEDYEEAKAIAVEVRDHVPRCIVCDVPATRRKEGTMFACPEFGCDVHMPNAPEVKWAKLARLMDGMERREQKAIRETTYSPITDEAVTDLYRGISAELEPGEDVEVGELLADMRHANLGKNRAERVAYLTDMTSRGVLRRGGVGVRSLVLEPPIT
jgi:hypothetical protein